VLAMLCVVSTAISYQTLKLALAFDARGVEVLAVATDRRKQEVRRNDRTKTDYFVTFSYVAQNVSYSVEKKVDFQLYRVMTPQRARSIRYLPENPRQMEHMIGQTWQNGLVARWASLVAGIGALAAFWWTARPVIDAMRARRYGTLKIAKVLKVEERGIGQGRKYVMVFGTSDRIVGETLPSSHAWRFAQYSQGMEIDAYLGLNRKLYWVGDIGSVVSRSSVPDVSKPTS